MARAESLTWRRLAARLAGFAALMLCLDFAIGTGLAALLPHVRSGQQIGAVNNALAAAADVVILGSSHAQRGYDDEALSRMLGVRVHNAALDGRGVRFARALLALICARHPPKLVVLDVSFSYHERDRLYGLAPFYGRSALVDRLLVDGDWRRRVKLASRSFRMNGVPLAIAANLFAETRPWGFEPLAGRLADDLEPDPNGRPPARLDAEVERSLLALVGEARQCGATLVFAESPTYGAYRPADVREMYARVSEAEHVPRLELDAEALARLGPAQFSDPGHLNGEGAAIVTAALAARLAPLLLDGRAPP